MLTNAGFVMSEGVSQLTTCTAFRRWMLVLHYNGNPMQLFIKYFIKRKYF